MLFTPDSFKFKYYFWIHMVEGFGQLSGYVNIHQRSMNLINQIIIYIKIRKSINLTNIK